MTPEELGRIREIYELAVRMSIPDRNEFLDRECQGDVGMRNEVERLIEAREHVPDWLDQPLVGWAPQLAAPAARMEGRHLSGYTLIREIGRGGMGSVYLGERSDGAFRKQVAVKLVQPGANAAGILARFQQEREILASFDHPNIARLIDGGSTEEGWPYFVMEFVDGQPIHQWCDERRLNISQRIELFRGVLAAVRYAHQRLVVHRDLKPGNVLVTKDGTVKLLDFGIARILSVNQPGKAPAAETLAGLMTPEYASPEQVNGASITTLTDVYSLGVVLYRLLTGHRPYNLRSAAMHEMARVISEVEPTRPSIVIATTEAGDRDGAAITPETVSQLREGDPVRLRKRLEGDLDCVVLTAMQKEPERRYGSVESFAEDLQRHLEHRPVTAREATIWYRAMRFGRRNPSGVAAVVLLVVSILAGVATVIWQVRHSLQRAGPYAGDIFLAPVWVNFCIIGAIALCVTVYFARPNRAKLLATATGGTIWGCAIAGKWWLEHNLGWWHSRFRDAPDPIGMLTPWIWLMSPLYGMIFLLLLSLVGRRFGSQAQVISLLVFGVYQETREHFYFSVLLPALTFKPGLTPILGGAAMLIAGGAMGLLAVRLIAGPERARQGR